jgi:predicted DNA helicase
MVNLVIRDLARGTGPGDIVGAFINEAKIESSQIGKIDFHDKIALVEIKDSVAKKVADVMNNNKIAGKNVRVEIDNNFMDRLRYIDDYVSKYRYLVQLERKEEMRVQELEIKNLTGRQREKKGRAILHLRGRDQGQGFAGKFLVKFIRQKRGETLPDTQISVGDLVMISKGNPLAKDNPTGTVVEMSNYAITVVFDKKPPKFIYNKGLRLDLYVNDITFQRMLDALGRLKSAQGRLAELRDKIVGLERLEFGEDISINFKNKLLNSSQQEAVKAALAAKDLFLVHGPPGTGKTVTAIEILEQSIEQDKSILATADSNTAVDNLVERLVKRGRKVLRVGHPARVTPLLREHTLDCLIDEHPKYQKAKQVREKAYKVLEEQKKYTHPSGRWRRGMSNNEIKSLAKQGRGSRGISPHKIKEMGEWLKLQDKIDRLFKKVDRLEKEAVRELIGEAEVVCATNSTAGSEVLEAEAFDLLLVDEATQATEPSTLIPFVKADKVILVGDHKQLPPTILNQKAKNEGLAESLFERLLEIYGSEIKVMLNTQYRMNEQIMNFASQEFYNGNLVVASEIKDINLKDLNITISAGNSPAEQAFNRQEGIIFFDTQGMEAPERSKKDSKSIYNRIEAELSVEIIKHGISAGIDVSEIALISPYKAQVDLVKKLLKGEEIEVNTIDGFQGREKEVVILSLVRSNLKGNTGFLKDIRRLNVSVTRAKRRLIIIGDSVTISNNSIYSKLIEYVKSNGYYYKL